MTDPNWQKGLIHIYCGNGKGKTTAAIGLMVRSAGYGKKSLLVQFLKNGRSGEVAALKNIKDISIITGSIQKFTNKMSQEEKLLAARLHEQYLRQAIRSVEEDDLDLLVLDEVLGAIETGLLPEAVVVDFLRDKPENLEVVLTGRRASNRLMNMADYISEIKAIKHPFERGVKARQGIEF